jgi:eukaryotic-like serine/threonine-protein kinase
MRARGCLTGVFYTGLLLLAFGASSYFWFTFWVRGKSIPTPQLIGRSLSDARAVASDLGLVVVVDNTKDRHGENVAEGAVVWQNRAPGVLIKRGTRIHVGQSLGPLVLRVPNVEGMTTRTALLQLSQANLRVGTVSHFPHRTLLNTVATDPPVGVAVPAEARVSLLVALERPRVAFVMPDLVDRRIDVVRYPLEKYGFVIANVKSESYPGVEDGTIIRQFPSPGGMVRSGDAISLVVAKRDVFLD